MPQFNVNLRDFARTGAFGPIHLGMSKDNVLEQLGKPPNWGPGTDMYINGEYKTSEPQPFMEAPIWLYDAMEFHFEGDRLFLIWCDYLDELVSNGEVFQLDKWVFETEIPSREKLEQILTQEGFSFSHDEVLPKLILNSGMEFWYDEETALISAIGCCNLNIPNQEN